MVMKMNILRNIMQKKRIKPCICSYCNNTFMNPSCLKHHLDYNRRCKIIRFEKAMEKVKSVEETLGMNMM